MVSAQTDVHTGVLTRMAFGALAMGLGNVAPADAQRATGLDGVPHAAVRRAHAWGIFEVWNTNGAILIGVIVLILSAIALLVGWHSRLAAVVVFILIVSFERRVPSAFNAGEGGALVRIEAFFLALMPCGTALSARPEAQNGIVLVGADEIRTGRFA